MSEIKDIFTFTLSKKDECCRTLEKTIDFLTNVVPNRGGTLFYTGNSFNLKGRSIVLFKREGKLIGKGIISETVSINEPSEKYSGYYLVEENSIEIFKKPITLKKLNSYVVEITNLTRDRRIDIKYLDNISQMIQDYTKEDMIKSAIVIRNYLDENNLQDFTKEEMEKIFLDFQEKFAPEILEKYEGVDVLNKIFIHDDDYSTLCYNLEYNDNYQLAGAVWSNTSNYILFKNKNGKWKYYGSEISKEMAINYAVKIRDALVEGAKYIQSTTLENVNDFKILENKLNDIFKHTWVSSTNRWVHKYYSMIFPDIFPIVHNIKVKRKKLSIFGIEPSQFNYAMDGQFYLLAKKSGIKLYSLFDEDILNLFNDIPFGYKRVNFKSDKKRNIIYFGAPGTGKSYNLNEDKDKLLKKYTNNYERVTFHPDYSYANFVGTFKPYPDGKNIIYKYVPGPFMRILKKALNNPVKPYLLIIEEINRANVAAVFGDVFQLLDRDENHQSVYPIDTTEDMKLYLNEDKIILPQNLFIWATMNSADQGVFTMDTAFKRRWDFKYFSINYDEYLIDDTHTILNDETIYWNDLRKQINDELLSYKINEDKLIGPFFAFNEFMGEEIPTETFKDIFKNKIIMYLFEDAARSRRNDLFSGARKNDSYITYSKICEEFDKNGIEIFCDNIKSQFISEDE